MNKRAYGTPGTPRFKIQRLTEGMTLLDNEYQKRYQSGVRMLLYLTKDSQPVISNVFMELSKCMDGATCGANLEMLRVIKFIIDTKTFGLKIKPRIEESEDWSLKFFL
jgi:hypothetical protein